MVETPCYYSIYWIFMKSYGRSGSCQCEYRTDHPDINRTFSTVWLSSCTLVDGVESNIRLSLAEMDCLSSAVFAVLRLKNRQVWIPRFSIAKSTWGFPKQLSSNATNVYDMAFLFSPLRIRKSASVGKVKWVRDRHSLSFLYDENICVMCTLYLMCTSENPKTKSMSEWLTQLGASVW